MQTPKPPTPPCIAVLPHAKKTKNVCVYPAGINIVPASVAAVLLPPPPPPFYSRTAFREKRGNVWDTEKLIHPFLSFFPSLFHAHMYTSINLIYTGRREKIYREIIRAFSPSLNIFCIYPSFGVSIPCTLCTLKKKKKFIQFLYWIQSNLV